jgi:FkbM family methyltransferase
MSIKVYVGNKLVKNRFFSQIVKQYLFYTLMQQKKAAVDNQTKKENIDQISFFGSCSDLVLESKAQLYQDVWVLWRSAKFPNPKFFVEVGACDPIRLSNSFLLEDMAGFSGILIEPNPKLAQKLRDNRTARVCEIAISNSDAPVELMLSTEPEFSRIRNSSKIVHNMFSPTGEVIQVQSLKLTEILLKNKVPENFTFLSIDIEGMELEALQSLDFSLYKPQMIAVEHNFRKDRKRIKKLLSLHGYVLDPVLPNGIWDDWYIQSILLEDRTIVNN